GGSDEKSRLIDEIDHWKMECVTEVDEPHHFVAAVAVQPASATVRVVCDHTDRITVEPREARHQRPAIIAPYLEKRIPIQYEAEQPPHVVAQLAVPWDY